MPGSRWNASRRNTSTCWSLDAFSSDAIPVHLLTKEAFELYERHLNTNAIIAVHVSNHYLDLEPVVVNLARHFGYKLASIDYEETRRGRGGSTPRPGFCCRAASKS